MLSRDTAAAQHPISPPEFVAPGSTHATSRRDAVTAEPRPARAPGFFSLTRGLLVLGLLAIAAVCVVSSTALSRFYVSVWLSHDADMSAHLIRNSVLQRHAGGFFGAPHEPTPERQQVERFLADLLWMQDVLRTKAYAENGRVLWTSDVPQMPVSTGENPELDRALRGELVIGTNFLKWPWQTKHEHLDSRSIEEPFVEFYIPVRSADGTRVIGAVEIYKSPQPLLRWIREGVVLIWLCNAAGGLLVFLVLAWIVRRGQRAVEREQHRLAADEGFAAVGEVAAAVAHNVHDPLGGIRTSVELLVIDAKAGRPTADLCRYAADIAHDAERIEAWVHGLLGQAQAGSRRFEAVQLNALVGRLVASMGGEAARRRVRIEWRGRPVQGEVRVDRLLLEQVLRMLVDKSLDALPEGGHLVVETRSAGAFAVIVIGEEGAGMPPGPIKGPPGDPEQDRSRGLDIVLPLAARTLERTGARIAAYGEYGRGRRLEVSVPLGGAAR